MTRRFPDTCDWSTNPAMTVRRLVLPLPLGPISAETVPGRKDVVQPWMTRFGARLPLASRTMGAYRRSTRSTRTRLRGARAVAASSSDAVDADGRIVGATGRVGTRATKFVNETNTWPIGFRSDVLSLTLNQEQSHT